MGGLLTRNPVPSQSSRHMDRCASEAQWCFRTSRRAGASMVSNRRQGGPPWSIDSDLGPTIEHRYDYWSSGGRCLSTPPLPSHKIQEDEDWQSAQLRSPRSSRPHAKRQSVARCDQAGPRAAAQLEEDRFGVAPPASPRRDPVDTPGSHWEPVWQRRASSPRLHPAREVALDSPKSLMRNATGAHSPASGVRDTAPPDAGDHASVPPTNGRSATCRQVSRKATQAAAEEQRRGFGVAASFENYKTLEVQSEGDERRSMLPPPPHSAVLGSSLAQAGVAAGGGGSPLAPMTRRRQGFADWRKT